MKIKLTKQEKEVYKKIKDIDKMFEFGYVVGQKKLADEEEKFNLIKEEKIT